MNSSPPQDARPDAWTLGPGDLPSPNQVLLDARLTGLDQNPVFRWILFNGKMKRVYPWKIIGMVPLYYLTASLVIGALYDLLPTSWTAAAIVLMAALFLPTAIQIRWLPNVTDWGFRKYWGGLANARLLTELGQAGVTPESAALGCLGSLNTPDFIRAVRRTAQFFVFILGGTALALSYLIPTDGYKLGLFFLCFQLGYLLHLIPFGRHLLLHRYADLFAAEARAIRTGTRRKMTSGDWLGLFVVGWIAVVLLGALSLALTSITLGSLALVRGPVFLAAMVPGFVAGHVQGTLAQSDQHQNVRKLQEVFKMLLNAGD